MARGGIPVCWLSDKRPSSKVLQSKIQNQDTLEKIRSKVSSVREKRYIKNGFVKSLIKFFGVPKGDDDVRVVYDGTASGFNDLIWVPSFSLPTVETLLRGTGPNTWMADLDIAEQFLNFNLDSYASQFVGIDLSKLFPEELTEDKFTLWERYIRCAMGLKNLLITLTEQH